MTNDCEDHCWKDVIPRGILNVHACHQGFVGPDPTPLAIDLCQAVHDGANARKAG
jgi:hypothetical protein